MVVPWDPNCIIKEIKLKISKQQDQNLKNPEYEKISSAHTATNNHGPNWNAEDDTHTQQESWPNKHNWNNIYTKWNGKWPILQMLQESRGNQWKHDATLFKIKLPQSKTNTSSKTS